MPAQEGRRVSPGWIPRWLLLPEAAAGADLDDPRTTEAHRRILRSKPFLRRLYADFYADFVAVATGGAPGPVVELGSGGGCLKELLPAVIATDVLALRDLDLRCSALALPFRDGSVKAFGLLNVFHHLGDAALALRELSRCLREGGRAVLVEPAVTAWGRFVWGRFHHEPLDVEGSWRLPPGGPLSGANIALPWIVFRRDRERLLRERPELRIVSLREHTCLAYLLSGGFRLRALVPSFCYPAVRALERVLVPLQGRLGMYQTIVLEKRG